MTFGRIIALPDGRSARRPQIPFHRFRAGTHRERLVLISHPETAAVLLKSISETDRRHTSIHVVPLAGDTVPLAPVADAAGPAPLVQISAKVDRIVVAAPDSRAASVAAALGQTEHLPQEVWLMRPGDAMPPGRGAFARENCVMLRGPAVGTSAALAKRGLDLFLASLALLLLLPVLVLVSLAIGIESPGPILFRQPRGGRGGQVFTVCKFRTMWHDAPGSDGSLQATRRDARVTRIGRLLRKTSIDELPQLFNVLNGTMSLVGPRPHPLLLDRKFMPLIERYSMRYRVLPGITGWAQVNGARGETRTVDEMERRVALDIEYIERQSLAFDLRILVLTLTVLAKTAKAY